MTIFITDAHKGYVTKDGFEIVTCIELTEKAPWGYRSGVCIMKRYDSWYVCKYNPDDMDGRFFPVDYGKVESNIWSIYFRVALQLVRGWIQSQEEARDEEVR